MNLALRWEHDEAALSKEERITIQWAYAIEAIRARRIHAHITARIAATRPEA